MCLQTPLPLSCVSSSCEAAVLVQGSEHTGEKRVTSACVHDLWPEEHLSATKPMILNSVCQVDRALGPRRLVQHSSGHICEYVREEIVTGDGELSQAGCPL